jgi:AraC family transcriptional regulator
MIPPGMNRKLPAERITVRAFSAARVVHGLLPPHEPDRYTQPVTWLRVSEPSEGLEIHPSAAMLEAVSGEFPIGWGGHDRFLQRDMEAIIWGISARFRMALLGARPIAELEADSLVLTLLAHIAIHYFGARLPHRVPGRLDQRRLVRVTDYIEEKLKCPPALKEIADVAAMSPYHFQRVFRATTGLSPHAYVMARRMERARRLLAQPGNARGQVAKALGFSDLSHFRRSYRRHFN